MLVLKSFHFQKLCNYSSIFVPPTLLFGLIFSLKYRAWNPLMQQSPDLIWAAPSCTTPGTRRWRPPRPVPVAGCQTRARWPPGCHWHKPGTSCTGLTSSEAEWPGIMVNTWVLTNFWQKCLKSHLMLWLIQESTLGKKCACVHSQWYTNDSIF